MSLSGERERRWGLMMFVFGAMLVLAAFAQPAEASTGPEQPRFCEEEVLHDFLAPLERLPRLHAPPASGQLGFGSRNILLRANSTLIVGGGTVGYRLTLQNYDHPAHPRWKLSTTLTQVDWRGRTTRVVDRQQRRVDRIGRGNSTGFEFEVDGTPAVYRLTIVFESDSGRKLGGYGLYVRAVNPTRHARLALSGGPFRPGDTVFSRIENRGTETVFYGAAYRIERYDGSSWALAPESPRSFILPLYGSGPGRSENGCTRFSIPSTMPPGYYRMSRDLSFGQFTPKEQQTTLTAEFEIVP